MKNLDQVLKHFNNDLTEWVSFLNEKINDGQEISRGKDPNDKSKQQKENEQPADEMPMDGMPPPGDMAVPPMPPIIDPSQAPGSQIAIGKKHVKTDANPDAVKIKLSGQKEKIDMKPRTNTLPVHGTY